MPHAIEVRDLRKIYTSKGSEVKALNGVSLTIPEGKIYGLLGPNGAGKSTFVKVLSTITAPSSGTALIRGYDVVKNDLDARRQMVVVLQQTAAETLLTVQDNLLIYAAMHGLSRAEAKKRLAQVAEEFELGDKLKKTVMDLSLGTKRRIQVAKIFMLDAPIIILDEATTGMDPLMKRTVMDRLRSEAKAGRTVLLTTQVLSEAEELCDQIVIIHKGQTLASGTLAELRKLSAQMFRVNITFAESAPDLRARLDTLGAVEVKLEDRKAELVFKGEQNTLLAQLAEVSRERPIAEFEVHGPDLEEIFVNLMEKVS